ncbi:MAG: hypothetical protein KF745_12305 [Phycisphaeraceae bacterium]|nr:hypothetical protein [Phycisphaeraceae bacterium]
MDHRIDRRTFMMTQAAALAVIGSGVSLAMGQAVHTTEGDQVNAGAWPGFPQQDPALVREIVGASHGNSTRVAELLRAHPALAKASYDWGYGDWESALGAASHVGNREIAEMLLSHGARLDLFAAAMLGMVDVVKAMVDASPGVEGTAGPHGITLLSHARAGKDEAMIAFLELLPAAGQPVPAVLSESDVELYLGEYTQDAGPPLAVGRTRAGMSLKAGGSAERNLVRVVGHQFHPAGAPNVRVTFTVEGGTARRIEIVEDAWFVAAVRV